MNIEKQLAQSQRIYYSSIIMQIGFQIFAWISKNFVKRALTKKS